MTSPFLIGFVIAAVLGTIVTDFRTADLSRDLGLAFSRSRWEAFVAGRGQSRRQWLFWGFSRLLRAEWSVILLVFWLLTLLGYALAPRSWVGDQPVWAFAGGSAVGFLAAPWVWLHFSRDLRGDDQGKSEALERYKFLSILLGVLIGVYVAAPALIRLLPKAEKLEAWGFAITVADRGSDVRSTVIAANPSSSQRMSANQRLTSNTQAANRFVTAVDGADLSNVLTGEAEAKDFYDLSGIDRDRAFIAYLLHQDNQRSTPPVTGQLNKYIASAEMLEKQDNNASDDIQFLGRVSPILSCADHYAKTINDPHLYLLHFGEPLEWLALRVKWSLGPKAPDPDLDRFDDNVREQAVRLRARMVESIRLAAQSDPKNEIDAFCPALILPILPRPFPTGATPYPALVAAYSFAAVESAEAGILTLSDWLKSKAQPGQAMTVRDRYYGVRAQINLLQLAAKELSEKITHDGAILLQRDTTDRLAALLHVASPKAWAALCENLAKPGMHNKVGRMLAFLYAVERGYLFELEDVDSVQLWRSGNRTELTGNLDRDLNEAQAFTETADCFRGVRPYEGSPGDAVKLPQQWLGQFRLNLVQLRLVQAVAMTDDDRRKLAGGLLHDLDLAEADLGRAPTSSLTAAPADVLLSSDPFADQRVRALRLRDRAKKLTQS